MIKGIGTDIIETERISKSLSNDGFIKRCFDESELKYIKKSNGEFLSESAAGNFAAKEAVSKAIGTGFRSFTACDIAVLRDELGKPYIVLKNGAKKAAEEMGIKTINISISHSKEYAVAFAVAEGE